MGRGAALIRLSGRTGTEWSVRDFEEAERRGRSAGVTDWSWGRTKCGVFRGEKLRRGGERSRSESRRSWSAGSNWGSYGVWNDRRSLVCEDGRLTEATPEVLCANLAGTVASMTEGDPDVESEKASYSAFG